MTSDKRSIRVFVSSTFRDMIAERDELMTHTWPVLRRLCQDRHVELVEVDLRWGIAEEQSTRKETLKLCLDEIRACRPFFIGLLGERYGWTPGDDAFTADLQEEQPWLAGLHGKSVTELEILHGVLNNPDMADRAFFYIRDPAYSERHGPDFLSETDADAAKQTTLKSLIRTVCTAKKIPLREDYPDPGRLAAMVLADLTAAIENQYPKEEVPDDLTREDHGHEAFAETRRRTYIGRPGYFDALDRHAAGEGGPLLLLGASGSGKSALLANWLEHWRRHHPQDFVVQHYIGGTADSADHWRLMTRLMGQIKRRTDDPEALPTTHDDMLKDFPLWLAKARAKAMHEGVRFILLLDALNQLNDQDHARLLGWLPEHPFTGPLRLIVSTLPGKPGADDPLEAARKRHWHELQVQPLTVDERSRMIADYLARFGKRLDARRLDRLASASAASNPLYLKILLDDLRVTGAHERLAEYLCAADIPALLQPVLARYQRDYERDRPGLVAETLGLIYAARRGLAESELLQLLHPADQAQLPPALWTPLRAALEDSLVDRGGILNFAHDFLRTALKNTFVADSDRCHDLRLQLADYFEALPITARTCDELPWLLKEVASSARLRACLLAIDRFLFIQYRDESELMGYWVWLKEERTMGKAYLERLELLWEGADGKEHEISWAVAHVTEFLLHAALQAEAEPLMRHALAIDEHSYGKDHPNVARALNNLAELLRTTNRLAEAEPLYQRALEIDEQTYGKDHPMVARDLNNLAQLLHDTNRLVEAEPLLRRAVSIFQTSLGDNHPSVASALNNLAALLGATNRLAEAEPLFRWALAIDEQTYGKDHPRVGGALNNLAQLLQDTGRLAEAEPLMRRAVSIFQTSLGDNHPNVASALNTLAALLGAANRLAEAELLYRRALEIDEQTYGKDHPKVAVRLSNLATLLHAQGTYEEAESLHRRALAIREKALRPDHSDVAVSLSNLACLLYDTNRLAEAELLIRRALEIDEQTYGKDHPVVATRISNLANLLQATNRLAEAEPLFRRALEIDERSYGNDHSAVARDLNNLAQLLQDTNRLAKAEPLLRRALEIYEQSHQRNHPDVARDLSNLGALLYATNRLAEAEPLVRRALEIYEQCHGKDHPDVATALNNLAALLLATNRLTEAEPLMRRRLEILLQCTCATGRPHLHLQAAIGNCAGVLRAMGRSPEQIRSTLEQMGRRFGIDLIRVLREGGK